MDFPHFMAALMSAGFLIAGSIFLMKGLHYWRTAAPGMKPRTTLRIVRTEVPYSLAYAKRSAVFAMAVGVFVLLCGLCYVLLLLFG